MKMALVTTLSLEPVRGGMRKRLLAPFFERRPCALRSGVLLPVVATLLTGCMSTSYPWPSDWPPLSADAPGAACPTLDGFYENTAEAADHPRFPDSFRQDLAARLLHAAPPKGLGRVELRQPDADTLEVTVFDLSGQALHQGTLRASAGDFACEAGTLWLRGITTVQKDGTGYGRSTERLGCDWSATARWLGNTRCWAQLRSAGLCRSPCSRRVGTAGRRCERESRRSAARRHDTRADLRPRHEGRGCLEPPGECHPTCKEHTMTIPPRPTTQAITTKVPTHLAEAFLQAVDEFFAQAHEQQTPGQRAAEIREQDRDAGLDSLMALLDVAERDTGQSGVVARFLAGLYNGTDYPFDLTELRRLDADLFEHCLGVLRLDNQPSVEMHSYVPDGEARWRRMIATWGLDKTPPPEPPASSVHAGTRFQATYQSYGNAPGYRDVSLFLKIEDGVTRAAPVELLLSAQDSADLACDLLDIHRFAWGTAGRGPLDRRPGEQRPAWLDAP